MDRVSGPWGLPEPFLVVRARSMTRRTFNSMTTVRIVSIFSLFVGCAVLAIAMAGTPRSFKVDAHEKDASVRPENCRMEEVLLDEGYGISRKEERRICSAED
jgi:hypothetical protein